MFLWCVRDGWRNIYTQRKDFFFPYLLQGARGCQRLHLHASRIVRRLITTDRLRVPRSTAILCSLSKSERVVLITWSLSGYTPVVPECSDCVALFTNYNVTACQSTLSQEERTENPWHVLCNTIRILSSVQERLAVPQDWVNATSYYWCEKFVKQPQ